MNVKDLLISVGEPHSAMTEAHIHDITTALVEKMRENMETMLPAFPFKDDKEKQVFIERALIVYEMGIKDGIYKWLKTNKDVFPELKEGKDERIRRVQKPALNVGPKFKKGEWLVENHPNNYARFLQILEIYNFNGKTNYVVSRDIHNDEDVAESEFIETHWHPFNIKDAKDGDVLASKDAVFIFKHKDKTGLSICRSYCEVIGNSKLGFGFDFSINGVYPATKEQRDTLEKAMADAGYTFDFEKKEMKKIINQI